MINLVDIKEQYCCYDTASGSKGLSTKRTWRGGFHHVPVTIPQAVVRDCRRIMANSPLSWNIGYDTASGSKGLSTSTRKLLPQRKLGSYDTASGSKGLSTENGTTLVDDGFVTIPQAVVRGCRQTTMTEMTSSVVTLRYRKR